MSALLTTEGVLALLLIVSLKGTVVLLAAMSLNRFLRKAPAGVRHVVWCTALFSLLLLPLSANGFQQLRVPVLPSSLFAAEVGSGEVRAGSATVLSAGEELPKNDQAALPDLRGQPESSSIPWAKIMIFIWLTGALLVLLRPLIGVIRLRRIVNDATELRGESLSRLVHDLSKQLNIPEPPRIMIGQQAIMPMTLGVLSPILLLPKDAEHWTTERCRVVVLHELLHVKRRDVLTRMLAQITCALHWFNPLAWYAWFQLRKEQEWACDEQVLATGINAPDYASHLFEIARSFRSPGWSAGTATGISSGAKLEDRLTAILKPRRVGYRGASVMVFSIAVMAAVVVPVFASSLVRAETDSKVAATPLLNLQTEESAPRVAIMSQSPSPTPQGSPTASPNSSPAPNTPEPEKEMINLSSAGFSGEDQNRLINNGIGPAYILELKNAGYSDLTVAQLIAFRSNDVRADYIASLKSVGYGGLSQNDLLALKTNGITKDVIKSFQAVNYADFKATNYIAFRSNGVTPEYLKSMKAIGYDQLTPKQIVDMWVAGVTADFIKSARSRGYSNLSPEQLIELKRHGHP
ncbi:MAG TPA: M56 family metallopeptidase [Pyrinomonadaceae bacterium]